MLLSTLQVFRWDNHSVMEQVNAGGHERWDQLSRVKGSLSSALSV